MTRFVILEYVGVACFWWMVVGGFTGYWLWFHAEVPLISVQTSAGIEDVIRVELTYARGPVVVYITKTAIAFINMSPATSLLEIGTPEITFQGTGISHERFRQIRQEIGMASV